MEKKMQNQMESAVTYSSSISGILISFRAKVTVYFGIKVYWAPCEHQRNDSNDFLVSQKRVRLIEATKYHNPFSRTSPTNKVPLVLGNPYSPKLDEQQQPTRVRDYHEPCLVFASPPLGLRVKGLGFGV